MTPGDLRERVTIERESSTETSAGGVESQWSAVGERWAQVKPVKGSEAVDAGRNTALSTYLVTVPYDRTTVGITPADRLVWKGTPLNITLAQDRGMDRRYITIEAVAGGAQ